MRKFHRWITVFIAIPMLFIALTGLASHVTALWPMAGPPPAAAPLPEGFVCPEGYRCFPAFMPTGPRAWVGFFHHLHSGETFGPIGTTISILAGCSLLFFAFSGIWMYVQMFRQRGRLGRKDIFWK